MTEKNKNQTAERRATHKYIKPILWLSFIGILAHSCMRIWYPPESPGTVNKCDPMKDNNIAKEWQEAVSQTGWVSACLQVAWGDKYEEARGVLVQVNKDGQLTGRNNRGEFDGQSPAKLPKDIAGNSRRFRLFVFPSTFTKANSLDQLDNVCQGQMAAPKYECILTSEVSRCWFYFEFRPDPTFNADTPVINEQPTTRCLLYSRARGPSEAPIIPDEQPRPEIKPEPQPESSLEVRPEPPQETKPEPRPEPPPEPKPELPPEPRPELPPEPRPELPPEYRCQDDRQIGKACTVASRKGVCQAGIWRCLNNVKTCAQTTQPSTEICDRKDNNCDGVIDNIPDLNKACTDTLRKGVCQAGTWKCVEDRKTCRQSVFSTPEICDKKDNNCNNLVDEGFFQVVSSAGSGKMWGVRVVYGPRDNIYVAGHFNNTVSLGRTTLKSTGDTDIFVARLTSTGQVTWVVRGGGGGKESLDGLAVDTSERVTIVGTFNDLAMFGARRLIPSGSQDIFVTRLNSSGVFQWAVRAGAEVSNRPGGVAADAQGNVYIAGGASGKITQFGTLKLAGKGTSDIFVASLNLQGTFRWAILTGGRNYETATDIHVTATQDIFLTGAFGYQTTLGTKTLVGSGESNVFVARMDSKGVFRWGTVGSGFFAQGEGVTYHPSGFVYVTGSFERTLKLGRTTLTSQKFSDAFVARLNASSGAWLWSYQIKGNGANYAKDITLSKTNDIYIAGTIQKTVTIGTRLLQVSGVEDAFIARLKHTTSTFLWAAQVKSTATAGGRSQSVSLSTDAGGNAYFCGNYIGSVLFGTKRLQVSANGQNAYVAKVSSNGQWLCP